MDKKGNPVVYLLPQFNTRIKFNTIIKKSKNQEQQYCILTSFDVNNIYLYITSCILYIINNILYINIYFTICSINCCDAAALLQVR